MHVIYSFTVCMEPRTQLSVFSFDIRYFVMKPNYNWTFSGLFLNLQTHTPPKKRQRACEVMLSSSFVAPHESLSAVPEQLSRYKDTFVRLLSKAAEKPRDGPEEPQRQKSQRRILSAAPSTRCVQEASRRFLFGTLLSLGAPRFL